MKNDKSLNAMEVPDEGILTEQIAENQFFQDFLLFLHELERRPLELTKTGNLKRVEISFFGEHFAIDIYHRDDQGKIMWPINNEDEVPHLLRIRQIVRVMKLAYKRRENSSSQPRAKRI